MREAQTLQTTRFSEQVEHCARGLRCVSLAAQRAEEGAVAGYAQQKVAGDLCAGEGEGLGVEHGVGFGVHLLACAQKGELVRAVVCWRPDGTGAAFHDDADGGLGVGEE